MAPFAFLSSFAGAPLLRSSTSGACSNFSDPHSPQRFSGTVRRTPRPTVLMRQDSGPESANTTVRPRRLVGIVGKARTKASEKKVQVESGPEGNTLGMKATAYWDSIGVLPLFFAGFAVFALGIKLVKVKRGELASGSRGFNKATTPKTVITSDAEEAELHVFRCGGCGYEMYPARGREFKFFPDSFKCPLCGTPKSGFWDLNDPDDPRNQEDDEEEGGEGANGTDDKPDGGGPALANAEEVVQGGEEKGGGETTAVDRAE